MGNNIEYKENYKYRKILKKMLIKEYIALIISIFIIILTTEDVDIGIHSSLDAFTIGILLMILDICISMGFIFINPIIKFIQSYKYFKLINNKFIKIFIKILILMPVILAVLIIFSCYISNAIKTYTHYHNPDSYTINIEDYKTPKDFEKELEDRGLIFDSSNTYYDFILNKLNAKYNITNDNQYSHYYYEQASLMTLTNDTFYDSKYNNYSNNGQINEIINFDSNKTAPAYIYNSIIYLERQMDLFTNEINYTFEYLPISRYEEYSYISGNNYPFYKDFYLECKILYVNNQIYAVLGVGESFSLSSNYENSSGYVKPYYMILSETEGITTYVDGKYYPNASINVEQGRLEMNKTSYHEEWQSIYPVRKVNKIDISSINEIAKELKDNVLKKDIEQFNNENPLQ